MGSNSLTKNYKQVLVPGATTTIATYVPDPPAGGSGGSGGSGSSLGTYSPSTSTNTSTYTPFPTIPPGYNSVSISFAQALHANQYQTYNTAKGLTL